jgi:membrane fusion protein, copper/silver efflux system
MMHRPLFLESGLLMAMMLGALGCKEGGSATGSGEQASTGTPSHAEHAEHAAAELSDVLASYERIRGLLADDQLTETSAVATRLKTAAREAAGKAPAPLGEHLKAIATAADTLAAVPATDAAALRKAFGEVSRPMVALIAADPKLAEGRHLFECPMAEGYQKWVQTSATVSNPYMGKKMPTCGTAAGWQ